MSTYIQTEDDDAVFIASNQGWGDFCRWVDKMKVADAPHLVHLREHGWSPSVQTLREELRAERERSNANAPLPDDLSTVLTNVSAFLDSLVDAEIVLITNGLTNGPVVEPEG